MAAKRKNDTGKTAQTALEEMVLLLFRGLTTLQQRKKIIQMRALFDANRISQSHLAGKPLRTVSDAAVEAAFKSVKDIPPTKRPPKRPGRPPDAPLDDVPEEPRR